MGSGIDGGVASLRRPTGARRASRVLFAGIETLGLIGDQFKMEGPFWDFIGALNDNFGMLGYIIIGIFVVSWLASVLIYRVNGYHELEARIGAA